MNGIARYHNNVFLMLSEDELNSVLSDVELLKSCSAFVIVRYM